MTNFLRGLLGRSDDPDDEVVDDEAPFGDAPSSGQVAIGEEATLEAGSPSRELGASFEDDGTTAYFYALDLAAPERVQAAIHVYDVSSASEGRVQAIEIRWSSDGARVGLFINGAVNAAFDFDRHLAYSRTQFGLSGRWTRGGWPDDVAGLIS